MGLGSVVLSWILEAPGGEKPAQQSVCYGATAVERVHDMPYHGHKETGGTMLHRWDGDVAEKTTEKVRTDLKLLYYKTVMR